MSERDRDPERLSSASGDPALRELLAAGKGERPTEARLAAMMAKLPTGGGPAGGGAGAGASAKGASAGAGLSGVKGGMLVVGALAVLYGAKVLRSHEDRGATKPRPLASAPSASPLARAPALDAGAWLRADDIAADDDTAPSPPPLPSLGEPPPPRTTAPPAPVAPVAPPPVIRPSPRDGEEEIRLLEKAEDALSRDPARALSLANEDVRRFPSGLLRQEAEVIAIDALVRSGQRDAAALRAARFRAAYPTSTHLRRVDALLGATPAEP